MTVEKWVFFQTLGGIGWNYPIINSINEAVSKGKIPQINQDTNKFFGDIYYKLNMLPRIIKRINAEWKEVVDKIEEIQDKYIFTVDKEAYGFPLDNDDLRYYLMIDIDSLLFEINSVCEFIQQFIHSLYNHLGIAITKKDAGLELGNTITRAGEDKTWFSILDMHRNLFMHNATPQICVEIIDEEEKHFELLILKENLRDFTDSSKFIKLSDLNKIVNGFYTALPLIQQSIVCKINSI